MLKLRYSVCIGVAIAALLVPQTAIAGSIWFSTPNPCYGNAAQALVALNPHITKATGQFEGVCTHGRLDTYVKLFSTNYQYNTGKRATNGSLLILWAPNPNGAYGIPNGMFVDRWVSSTMGSSFVAP